MKPPACPVCSRRKGTRCVPVRLRFQQQVARPRPQLSPQPHWLPPQELPQQHQSRMTMMISHRQEQSLFPLLKHMIVTSL